MPDKAQDDDLVMSLVDLALARPADEREAYVQTACGGDPRLFSQVWNYVQWEQRMNGFLLEPLPEPPVEEHPFEPGELLESRFRIVREVAQGGMGVVYEAVDERLQRRIALKCAKAGFNNRLPPEVRNASEISHPNICKTFEIHTAFTPRGEIDFLTMEFLDGETLADRLRAGPLPPEQALMIARQLCAGLAEAHLNQVIHGDLKSNNVILTTGADGALRAVVTDFGLARRPEAAMRAAQSGQAGGTPDYMAPELWQGEKASLASDVYALGVILRELASDRRVIGRCLETDPAKRYRNAQEVGQALAPRSRRWFLGVAAAAMLAVVSGAVTYQRATAPPESVRLAVLPFESGPETAAQAADLTRGAAAKIALLKGNARTSFKTVRDKQGATHVLHGSLAGEKGKLILHAWLTDAHSNVNEKEWTAEYDQAELRFGPVALAGLVSGVLRLPPLTAPAAVNAAARKDYSSGLSYLRFNSTIDAAIPPLERAAAADPDSPLTQAALAEAQWFKYFLTKDKLWLERTTESVRRAERRNPDLAQVHSVAGLLLADAGWYEQAEAEYRRAIDLEPGNAAAYGRLGMALDKTNRLDEAVAAFSRAIELEPNYYRNHQRLGALYNKLAKYDEAARCFQKTVDLAPGEPDAHFALGLAYMNSGRYAEAEDELGIAIRLGETPTALHTMGVALVYQGKYADAVPYLLRALRAGPERYNWWTTLGIAYRRMNLPAESQKANRRGLELAEAEMRKNPRRGYVRSFLAYLCARLGDRRRAESEIAQALQQTPNDADVRWLAVATYEALGRREDTLTVLSASPYEVIADIGRNPDLADLRQDSRFSQLLVSRRPR